jgi:hypothetical protein
MTYAEMGFKFIHGAALEIRCKLRHVAPLRDRLGEGFLRRTLKKFSTEGTL